MSETRVTADGDILSYDQAMRDYTAYRNQAEATIKELRQERDESRQAVERLTFRLDQVISAWTGAQTALAREQEMSRQAFKRTYELQRAAQQYQAAMRTALSPEQWLATVEEAKRLYPDVWKEDLLP